MSRTRKIEKKVRFTEPEFEHVKEKVKEFGFDNFQFYALTKLIQGKVEYKEYSQLRPLVLEVRKTGQNINQTAKLAHQYSSISSIEIQLLTDSIKTLTRLVDITLKQNQKK